MISVENQSAECVDIDPFAIVESSVVADPSCDSVITSAAQIRAALSICNGVYVLKRSQSLQNCRYATPRTMQVKELPEDKYCCVSL